MLSELSSLDLKLYSKQCRCFAPDCGATAKQWLATYLLNQNKAGRPCWWAVYVFNVYGKDKSLPVILLLGTFKLVSLSLIDTYKLVCLSLLDNWKSGDFPFLDISRPVHLVFLFTCKLLCLSQQDTFNRECLSILNTSKLVCLLLLDTTWVKDKFWNFY
jgi:hypothetical protein